MNKQAKPEHREFFEYVVAQEKAVKVRNIRANDSVTITHPDPVSVVIFEGRADEAPAMVTGAVAAHDYLQIHFAAPNPDLEEAAEVLKILDQCIERYELIRGTMITAGTWENFPEPRRVEMEQAHRMVRVLREADREIFKRLSGGSVSVPEAPADKGMVVR